jgi:HAD superfamily hydrolase (TIGR01490 family)
MEITTSKNKLTSGKYIAFFDLDRTIISENSGKVLIRHAYKKGLLPRRYVLWGMYLSLLYKWGLKDPVSIIKTITKWLKGVTETALNDLSEEIFETSLKKSIRPEIETKINFHRSNGGLVVILSSSLYPVCKAAADHLKMDGIICSKLETCNGIYTGHPNGSFCFDEEKVNRITEYCKNNNTTPDEAWYYGDSIADLPALSLVGHPVCINPDKKLLKTSCEKGWEIITCI